MKFFSKTPFRFLLPTLFWLPFATETTAANDPLHPWQWQNRILLLEAHHGSSDEWLPLLQSHAPGINERHLLWFMLTDSGMQTNAGQTLPESFAGALHKRYFSDPEIAVVLVGKDGGVKMRQEKLDLGAIFTRIDAMPMRRAEKRHQE